jgi:hypothetical protein
MPNILRTVDVPTEIRTEDVLNTYYTNLLGLKHRFGGCGLDSSG